MTRPRIAATYAARTEATNKNSLYDSYIRAFRWATDRITNDGIVCFVSNGGWINSNSAAGFRKTLVEEFDHIYVFNLRGNTRASGEQVRREGGKVFGQGSRSTIAVTMLIRTGAKERCHVRYWDIGDYLSRSEKLSIVGQGSLNAIQWTTVAPNQWGDWVNFRDANYGTYNPLGQKASDEGSVPAIFDLYSNGVKTQRDAWCWGYSRAAVSANTERMIANYNQQVHDLLGETHAGGIIDSERVGTFIDTIPTKINWTRSLKDRLRRGRSIRHDSERIVVGAYRPFCKERFYFDSAMNEMVYQQPRIFPDGHRGNVGICLTGTSSHFEFCCLIADRVPDLHLLDTSQFFPRYRYVAPVATGDTPLFQDTECATPEMERVDNVTDISLVDYRATFGNDVTKDAIFYYVYGLLHLPEYRARYAADLGKALPRIPKVKGFREFSEAGRCLADLHLGYEAVIPYPLDDPSTLPGFSGSLRVHKMRFVSGVDKKADRSRLAYNGDVTLAGIPEEAHRYQIGPRSAIEWLIDRYQVKTDKDSGIVNDPNAWCDEVGDPRYIIDLVKRIVTVSLETMRIVDSLPPLDLVQ